MAAEFSFNLKPAIKQAIPPLISLWGPQGCGKTLSALKLARGIVGPAGKIGVADTENGRALFYANHPDVGEWFHLDVQPPFTPEKYSAAFKFLEDSKMDIIIVDSGSHVWGGEGGVLDQADSATTKSGGEMYGLAKWKAPKTAHKRMMNNLTRAPIPVIFCLRAKEGTKQIGKGKDMEIIQTGWQPICEKNMPYEMTVDLRMTKDGHYDLAQSKTIPEALRSAIKPDGLVNVAMGQAIAQWCGSGAPADPILIALKRDGKDAALQGAAKYTAWLAGLPADQKEKIRSYHKEWSADAKARDTNADDLVGRIAKAILDAGDLADLEATWAVDYSDDLAALAKDKPDAYARLKATYDEKAKSYDLG